MKNQKMLWIVLGSVGGLTAIGVGAAMVWNAQGVYLRRCALWDSRTSSKSAIGRPC